MNEFWHILDRFQIHFFASMSAVMLLFFAVRTAARKLRSGWLPVAWKQHLLMAALAMFAISTLREAWDVSQGQTVLKAFADYASWLLGCGVSAWGLYRFKETHD